MLNSIHFAIAASAILLPTLVAPPPLPSPPLHQSLFLETPGSWVVVLLAITIAAVLITRHRRSLKYTGIAACVLAITVAALQYSIVTDREEILIRTRAAVLAVARADGAALAKLLAPNFKASYYNQPAGIARDETIAESKKYFADNPVDVNFGEVQAAVENDRFGRAQVQITASGTQTSGYPFTSWWSLAWEKTSNGWQISRAEMTQPTNLP